MKRFAVPLIIMLVSVASYADENQNPFVRPRPTPADGAGLPRAQLALEDPLPQSFTENRSVFDLIEVVGRGGNYAILRYPMTGSTGAAAGGTNAGAQSGMAASMQGISYSEKVVRGGRNTFIGGRSFKVELPRGGTSVLLVDVKNGKVLWEGDLSSPKVYYVNPLVNDYQYVPPMSAGTGIGQSTSRQGPSSSGAAGGQPAVMGQGVQQAGVIR